MYFGSKKKVTHKAKNRPEEELTEEQLINKINRIDVWRAKLELQLREKQTRLDKLSHFIETRKPAGEDIYTDVIPCDCCEST